MALRDEKTGKFIPQETKSIKEIAANIKNENDSNKTQQQLLIAGNKINELKLKSEDLGTQKLDYTLQAIMDRLSNPKTTESGMRTALANLDNLVAESNALEASRAQAADLAADKSTQGLQQLTDSIKNQNAIINSQLDMNKLGDQISKLNTGVGRLYDNEEARMQIEESFAEGQSALLRAIEEGDNQAAEIALSANSKMLILGHFSARYDNIEKFVQEASSIFKNTVAAYDGYKYQIKNLNLIKIF